MMKALTVGGACVAPGCGRSWPHRPDLRFRMPVCDVHRGRLYASCLRKVRYRSKGAARWTARCIGGPDLTAYSCRLCCGYHVGNERADDPRGTMADLHRALTDAGVSSFAFRLMGLGRTGPSPVPRTFVGTVCARPACARPFLIERVGSPTPARYCSDTCKASDKRRRYQLNLRRRRSAALP